MSDPAELQALLRAARTLGRQARRRKPTGPSLPALFFVTDPVRTPDPLAVARRLPRGSGIVYRGFGAPDALQLGLALGEIARARGLMLLVGQDARLARACGAHGVHLPERDVGRARRLRAVWPGAVLTGAVHGAAALRRAATAGLDAALLSAVFPSLSPSAGPPLGPVRFAGLVRAARLPVYALGGVNVATAPRLVGSGAAGVAAVAAFHRGLKPDDVRSRLCD